MSPGPGGGFAALLRARRRSAGLTQDELARKAGVGVRTLRDLENGRAARPQRSTVELLANGLGLVGPDREEFVAVARGWVPPAVDTVPEAPRIGLPAPSELIGRNGDVQDIAALLEVAGLVTLVGLAGVGKTGLAVVVGHHVVAQYPGGTGGVSITDVTTEADVLASVASVFGVPRAADLPQRFGAESAGLLVVDGVERNAEPAATAVAWLRRHVPGLRILATSRHPLGVPGEHQWPVTPLDVPPPEVRDERVFGYPAVELFLSRLRRVRRRPVEADEAATVAALVRRLDGLPLGLELAAARGRVLELPEILSRYGERVLDLGGDTRTAGATLRDAVAASCRLLDPAEFACLRRLSVFNARWSLELAEAMLAGLLDGDIVALIDRLVALGLISARSGGQEMRFWLLDVVRDYARESAEAAGDLQAARIRHAQVMAQLASRTAPELAGPAMAAGVKRLDYMVSDLRAALDFAVDHDPVIALRLAAKLPRWWRFRGRDREGRELLRRLLDDPRTADADPRVRAWAQLGLAQLATEDGDGRAEVTRAEAALATFIELRDSVGELFARSALCVIWRAVGGYDESRIHAEAALALAMKTGNNRQIALAHNNLVWHEIRTGDLEGATRRLGTVMRLAAESGEQRVRAIAQADLAEVARLAGRLEEALATGRRAVSALAELGDPEHRARLYATIGLAAAQLGREAEAIAAIQDIASVTDEPAAVNGGLSAMIQGYVALSRTDRVAAAGCFSEAAEALAGHHDVRDVVEALVGLAASAPDEPTRARALADLEVARDRTGVILLPPEQQRLT